MKIANKNNYPIAVVNAANDSSYKPDENRIRVTELINPPLIRRLTIDNWDKIEIDVDDLLVPLFGTAFHNFLLGYEPKDNVIFKQRFDVNIDSFILSGEPDKFNIKSGQVEDYKVTSAWAFVFGRDEWERQLNLYAYLLSKHGYKVHTLQINAFLKDWTYYQAIKKGNWDYPKKRFVTQRVRLWSFEDTKKYIDAQVLDHSKNYNRECTFEERWEKPTTYAVMKDGRKSALRVLNNEEEAKKWMDKNTVSKAYATTKEKVYIEKRCGERIRCNQYCSVNKFCPYYKENK